MTRTEPVWQRALIKRQLRAFHFPIMTLVAGPMGPAETGFIFV